MAGFNLPPGCNYPSDLDYWDAMHGRYSEPPEDADDEPTERSDNMDDILTLKTYTFTAHEPHPHGCDEGRDYDFTVYELPGGEAWVPEEQTNDCFYACLDEVEAHGFDVIKSCVAAGEIKIEKSELVEAITGSAREFGKAAIPETLRSLIENENENENEQTK